ncbi:hypothetical protein NLI96_g10405 [Meripilus lineatus]|uniref:Uncharacterized protein n=1 Tax=Meripilus lineatus TaxID=2056292 RepID=A0AAD5UVH3_9APHY|nr:hypothetical protein NLI96_g10405 [Physisporinus lineatus]
MESSKSFLSSFTRSSVSQRSLSSTTVISFPSEVPRSDSSTVISFPSEVPSFPSEVPHFDSNTFSSIAPSSSTFTGFGTDPETSGSVSTSSDAASISPSVPLPPSSASGSRTSVVQTESSSTLNIGPIVGGVAGGLFGVIILSICILCRRRRAARHYRELGGSQSCSIMVADYLTSRFLLTDTSVKPFRPAESTGRASVTVPTTSLAIPETKVVDAIVTEDGTGDSLSVNPSRSATDTVAHIDAHMQPSSPLVKHQDGETNPLLDSRDTSQSPDRNEPTDRRGVRRVHRQFSDSGIRLEPPTLVEFVDVPPAYTRS